MPGPTSEGHLEWWQLSLGIGMRIPQVSMWRFTLSRDKAQGEALSLALSQPRTYLYLVALEKQDLMSPGYRKVLSCRLGTE